ncbi:hypothetical protein RHODOP_02262 [Rhodoplanes sp. P11]|uniref:transposase n=1 Tax=Rhodoplanes sp. P11 TaxID=3157621 RepID=UPI0035EBFDDD
MLGNEKVTVARLIEGWSSETGPAAAGRHVLAIQDTSEITISTRPGRRRGLGEIGKGTGHGLLVHAMLALDADTGASLGLVGGATGTLDLPARSPQRPARSATLTLRFGPVVLRRPRGSHHRHLPESVPLTLVEVVEHGPPAGVVPLHWRLLTTHPVDDAAAAWRIVDWYRRRWTIEQLFRLMKTQGLRLEDSQIETADRLQKLAAVATKAAAVTLALLQARDGTGAEPAGTAFTPHELDVLDALDAAYRGRTALQRNPHPPRSLPWAAWIIARLGGWDGYPSSRPPGPITFRHGLEQFKIHAAAAATGNLCMP